MQNCSCVWRSLSRCSRHVMIGDRSARRCTIRADIDVPTLTQAGVSQISPRALTYVNVRDAVSIAGVALIAGCVVVWTLDGAAQLLFLTLLAVLTVTSAVTELLFLNRLRVRYTSYTVDPEIIYIARGALIRRRVLIPTRQVLNVESVQGPLLRKLGLAEVRFKSITHVESLGPLDPAAVVAIRRTLAELGERTGCVRG